MYDFRVHLWWGNVTVKYIRIIDAIVLLVLAVLFHTDKVLERPSYHDIMRTFKIIHLL